VTILVVCALPGIVSEARGGGEKLYGVHWWDYANPAVGSGPTNGWSVETVVTESEPWWRAPFFAPLYQQATAAHGAEFITRVDYNWGQTVPASSHMSAADWANRVVSDVVGVLGPYSSRWVIGNEPNITSEGNGWASNQITPTGYAEIYLAVRQAIRAQRPQDEVLFAPVSPGGVIADVRWKDGNQWLAEAIDATLAMPGAAIDGFALHAYGNPFAGAAQAVTGFHDSFVSQLAVIDARGLTDVPVYITEWNRSTSTTGNLAGNEQVSADFLRQSLLDVDKWNRTPGNHNIRSLAWFVAQDYGAGGWSQYSLEWWQTRGNPAGHPGDLWTALMESDGLAAGLVGTRPWGDYNGDGIESAADWEAWRAEFGRTDWPFADGSRNGVIDAADYTVWRDSLAGVGAGAVLAQAPEVSVVWQLVGTLAGLAVRPSHAARTSRLRPKLAKSVVRR